MQNHEATLKNHGTEHDHKNTLKNRGPNHKMKSHKANLTKNRKQPKTKKNHETPQNHLEIYGNQQKTTKLR